MRELCEELEAAGVSYCHWKGNAYLDRALRAEDDLDLLVRRADVDVFTAALHRLGFKEARSARAVPGVSHYYGYDREADRLVHVHAYHQLIVGDDLTENYRLPLETALLAAAFRDGPVPVPPPELELIGFVIRKTLEHSTWDAMLVGRGRLPAKSRKELALLQAQADAAAVDRLLALHLPFIEPSVFAECLHALGERAGAWARIRAGRRLVARLEPHSRHSRFGDVTRKLARRGVQVVRRLASRPWPRKRLAGGGAIIALVGGDGAGKSTVVGELFAWLSNDLAVEKVHLGKPAWSWTTFLVRGSMKARAELVGRARRNRGAGSGGKKTAMLLALTRARDRHRAYIRARRFALGGGLVICDRFPLPQLTSMDAPRIEPAGRLPAALSRREKRYYRRIAPPDVLLVLRVDPEVAVQRQPSDEPDFTRRRWREIWELDWHALGAHVIDAGRSPAEVLSEIKSVVWSEI